MALALVTAVGRPGAGDAQVPSREAIVTAEGRVLDFAPDGVWRARGRQVVAARARLRAAGRLGGITRDVAPGIGAALSGTLAYPAVLLAWPETDTSALFDAPAYQDVLFAVAPTARPYSVRSLYAENSNALLTVTGRVLGWVKADTAEALTIGPCPGTGGLCGEALRRLTRRFREVLGQLDPTVDFRAFDNDGPDGVPNSGDDDGAVDVIQFIQPSLGAECRGPGFWAHKATMSLNDPVGGPYVTTDTTPSGVPVRIDSYFLTSGVGGGDCDAPAEIMGIGLSAHELGHGLGLPDLYDTGGGTEGIGEWGLMGSAMYTSLASPGHLSAWSKVRLGWVTEREVSASGPVAVGPVVSGDTVLVLRPPVANPRGEHFLLEHKQPLGSDTTNLLEGGQAGPKGRGLLVWHVDSVAVAQRLVSNTVNAGAVHGVALVQADGLGHLDGGTTGNRGDGGDPFPGSTGNTSWSLGTVPAAVLNHDGRFAGISVDSIRERVPGAEVAFRLRYGPPAVVRASDTAAMVMVDGLSAHRYEWIPDPTATYTISIDSVQTVAGGRTRLVFADWSDGGARTHAIQGVTPGDSLVARVGAAHRLQVDIVGSGGVVASVPGDLAAGVFRPEGEGVTVRAQPAAGQVVEQWTGPDTTAVGDSVFVRMVRPYDLDVQFVGQLVLNDSLLPGAVVGAEYRHVLSISGGLPTRSVSVAAGAFPPGVTVTAPGVVTGTPARVGAADVTLRVRSGRQSIDRGVRLDARAPVVALEPVLRRLVGLDALLDPDHVRYLDLIGNANGRLDVADFLAWVEAGGAGAGGVIVVRGGGR